MAFHQNVMRDRLISICVNMGNNRGNYSEYRRPAAILPKIGHRSREVHIIDIKAPTKNGIYRYLSGAILSNR